jgi:hypothetical protein
MLTRLLAVIALLVACHGGGDSADGKKDRGPPSELTAADLYRDYSALRGTAVLDTYAAGVVVTGTIAKVEELGDEGLQIWLAVDRGAVALAFADLGAEVRQKTLRAGAALRARCQVGGKPEEVLYLTACTLR